MDWSLEEFKDAIEFEEELKEDPWHHAVLQTQKELAEND